MIRKEKNHYVLYNHDGTKVLGRFATRKEAVKREREINYFKNRGK